MRRPPNRWSPGGPELDLAEVEAWYGGLPDELDERERYTATLLRTLARIDETAPFDWGLTGGTALQSYLPEQLRRYSTDLEIITEADADRVEQWMEEQGYEPNHIEELGAFLCSLTPDGALGVIPDYPPDDFQAADVTSQAFDHYPIETQPPPGQLEVPLLSFDFLLATKVFAIQEPHRGGERKKDAYDLALALPQADSQGVLDKLEVYAAHRARPGEHEDVARSAGAWMQHFATDGHASLARWLPNYVPDGDPEEIQAGLEEALDDLEAALGETIELTAEEQCRFLFGQRTPAELAPVAERIGFEADPVRQSEKLRDAVLEAVVEQTDGDPPTGIDELRATLDDLGREKE